MAVAWMEGTRRRAMFVRERLGSWEATALAHPAWTAAGVHLVAKAVVLAAVWWSIGRPVDFWDRLALAWDGEHFMARAKDGYQETGDFAFGPGYPWLVRLLGTSTTAMLVVSQAASVAAVAVVARLMGLRAALFLGFFPVWLVYGSAGYSEALFVLLAAGALAIAHRASRARHGLDAGLLAAGAVLTRYSGAIGLAAVGLWLLARHGTRRAGVAFATVGALTGAAVLAWHHVAGGSARVYLEAQEAWSARLAWPWEHVDWVLHGWFTNQSVVSDEPAVFLWRNLAFWAIAVAGLWRLWRIRRIDLLAYSAPLVVLLVCTTGTPAISLPRLALAAFPAMAVHGAALRNRADVAAYALLALPIGMWIMVQHLTGGFFA